MPSPAASCLHWPAHHSRRPVLPACTFCSPAARLAVRQRGASQLCELLRAQGRRQCALCGLQLPAPALRRAERPERRCALQLSTAALPKPCCATQPAVCCPAAAQTDARMLHTAARLPNLPPARMSCPSIRSLLPDLLHCPEEPGQRPHLPPACASHCGAQPAARPTHEHHLFQHDCAAQRAGRHPERHHQLPERSRRPCSGGLQGAADGCSQA